MAVGVGLFLHPLLQGLRQPVAGAAGWLSLALHPSNRKGYTLFAVGLRGFPYTLNRKGYYIKCCKE